PVHRKSTRRTPRRSIASVAYPGGRSRLTIGALGWNVTNTAADLANPLVAMSIPPALGGTMSPFAPLAYLASLPITPPQMASYAVARRWALSKSPELQRQIGYFTHEQMQKSIRDLGRKRRLPTRILEAIGGTAFFL